MDVVIYTRVSTEDQKENGFSLQDQERRLRQYCRQKGFNIIRHYQDECSGKNFNRPEFQRFLNDLKVKNFKPKSLVCVRFDRFSRNAMESLTMISKLKPFGLELIFSEQNYDLSTPENLIPFMINIALPQVENERRGLNTKHGMRQAMREGRCVNGAPKGYVNDKLNKRVIKGKDVHFILKGFKEVSQGLRSIDAIRKELASEGFKCSKQQFLNLLRNPFYIGKIKIKEWKEEAEDIVQGLHDPLIDEETFNRVQSILNSKGRNFPKPSKYQDRFPLRGHLECPVCGNSLTASSSKGHKKKYAYYHCQNGCKERVRADDTNEAFLDYLESLQMRSEIVQLYKEIIRDVFMEEEGSKEQKIQQQNRKLNEAKQRRDNIDDQFTSGSVASEDYNRLLKRINKEIQKIEDSIYTMAGVQTNYDKYLDYGLSFMTHIKTYFVNAPIEVKHKMLDSIFPEKLIFDGKNYRTTEMNSFVSLITSKSKSYDGMETRKAAIADSSSNLAPPLGLEPRTY